MSFSYPQAGGPQAQPEVQVAVDRYRRLPVAQADKADVPLLYWLLGSGTPEYKMAPGDAQYAPAALDAPQRCSSCIRAYVRVTTGDWICSQVSGHVHPDAVCRLWTPLP